MTPPATDVVLALGANLGDAAATLDSAVRSLRAVDGVTVTAVSAPFVTTPVGGPPQPDYVNAVVLVATTLGPRRLLAAVHAVEAAHGRERSVRWGARTLDVDLVAWGAPGAAGEVVSVDPVLTLPHPRAHERAFVLVPWADVEPAARLRLPDGSVAAVADLVPLATDAAGVRPLGVRS